MTAPIELWYWPTPNGWKVSIALEEMGLPYELKLVNIGIGEQFTPEFQAISPNGRMPAIIEAKDYETWLTGEAEDAVKLLRPSPDGSFTLEQTVIGRSTPPKRTPPKPEQMKLF